MQLRQEALGSIPSAIGVLPRQVFRQSWWVWFGRGCDHLAIDFLPTLRVN